MGSLVPKPLPVQSTYTIGLSIEFANAEGDRLATMFFDGDRVPLTDRTAQESG